MQEDSGSRQSRLGSLRFALQWTHSPLLFDRLRVQFSRVITTDTFNQVGLSIVDSLKNVEITCA
jgi:hypothetical protein